MCLSPTTTYFVARVASLHKTLTVSVIHPAAYKVDLDK